MTSVVEISGDGAPHIAGNLVAILSGSIARFLGLAHQEVDQFAE